jgi:hypothetical protein
VQVSPRRPICSEPELGACGSGQGISWLVIRSHVRRPERQHHFWNVNRSSEPRLGANECAPAKRSVVQAHDIPVFADGHLKRQKEECRMKKSGHARREFYFCILHSSFCLSLRARSSKRTVRLISGVALDECRVPERYRTRAPFHPHSSNHRADAS